MKRKSLYLIVSNDKHKKKITQNSKFTFSPLRNPVITADNMHCSETTTPEDPRPGTLCVCRYCGGNFETRVSIKTTQSNLNTTNKHQGNIYACLLLLLKRLCFGGYVCVSLFVNKMTQ